MFAAALQMLAKIDLWVGASYSLPNCGVLVLGESWPGQIIPLTDYIPQWLAGTTDTTYTQITNGFLASRRSTKSKAITTAQTLWDEIAFMNFVPGSIGTIANRPSGRRFKEAVPIFRQALTILRPQGCLILGYGQSDYSRKPCEMLGIPYVIVPHPRHSVSRGVYAYAWDCINRIKISSFS